MYSIGLDIGSSSIKAAMVDEQGTCIARSQVPQNEMEIHAPQPGWAEQDPNLWWEYACQCIQQLLQNSGQSNDKVVSVGIAYQMHGLVLIDNEGLVLRPSIIWCDSRATALGDAAFDRLGKSFCLQHYLNSPGNFTASKLAWVREHEPGIYERIDRVLLPGDYIAYKLTGAASTTISGLSEGIFWDFEKQNKSSELISDMGLSTELLPDLVPTFGDQGRINSEAAEATGLKKGTLVSYRAGDQPNNALALGVLNPGQVAATAGTSGVIYGVTATPQSDERSRVNYFAHVNYSKELPLTGLLLCVNGTGILHSWMRKLTGTASYQEMEDLASEVPVGSEGVVVLPFGNGAERIFDNKTVGSHIQHLDFNRHSVGHLVRAGLEGIACAFNYGASLMKILGTDTSSIRVGNDNLFQSAVFAQTVANLTGGTIEVLETSGAEGAAKGALFGAERSKDLESLLNPQPMATYAPEHDERYEQLYNHWTDNLAYTLNKTT